MHEVLGARLGDRGANRRLRAVEPVAVERADEQQVRRIVGHLARERRVRADDDVHVLVRIEAAHVDEPARAVGQPDALARRRHLRLGRRIVRVGRRFHGHANALAGDAEHLGDLATRELGDGEHELRLRQREANLRVPEEPGARRGERHLRMPLGDRIVHGDHRGLRRRQREVRVDGRREEHPRPLPPHRAREPQHVAHRARAVGRGRHRGWRTLRDHDETQVRCTHVEAPRRALVGEADELVVRRERDHGAQQLAGEATVATAVGPARRVHADAHDYRPAAVTSACRVGSSGSALTPGDSSFCSS